MKRITMTFSVACFLMSAPLSAGIANYMPSAKKTFFFLAVTAGIYGFCKTKKGQELLVSWGIMQAPEVTDDINDSEEDSSDDIDDSIFVFEDEYSSEITRAEHSNAVHGVEEEKSSLQGQAELEKVDEDYSETLRFL